MKKILLTLCLLMIVKISFSQTIGQEILNYSNGCGNPTTDSGGVVIRTKYPFIATGYMPTMIIEGYNYGLNQSVGLIINWYVYNNGSIPYFYHKSISSYGAYAPEAYIYNDAGFVSIFLKRGVSQYCLSFKVRSWLRDINESGSNNSWYLGWTANTINTPPAGVNNYQNLRYENTIGDATVLGGRPIRLNSGAGSIKIKGDTGGWAMDHGFLGSGGADLGGFWGYGAANAIDQWSIGKAYTDNFFVVKSSGNVGIGTNTPTTKLEVNSGVNDVSIFKGTAGIAAFRFYNDINKGVSLFTYKSDYSVNSGSVFSVGANGSGVIQEANAPLAIGTWQVAQPLIFGTNSVEKMRILADGKVGIGTSTPSEKLTVYGVNNVAPAILSLESSREDIANADVAMIKFKNSGNEIARIGTIRPAGSYTGLINFWVKKTNETPLFEAMRISESGNVGIGTTNPQLALHIAGNNLTQKNAGIQFSFDSNNNYNAFIRPYWNSATDSRLGFGITPTASGIPSEQMTILGNGNVGIGVTAPTEKLTVIGGASFKNDATGTIIANDGYLGGRSYLALDGNSSNGLASGSDYLLLDKYTSGSAQLNNSGGELKIVTQNAHDISIVTNNTINTTFKSNGSVGIGTTVPNTFLEVNSSGTDTGTLGQITTSAVSGLKGISGINFKIDVTNLWQMHTDNTAGNGFFLQYNENKAKRYFAVNVNGNVGIGTITPTEKLSVLQEGGTTPFGAFGVDVTSFSTTPNALNSYFFRVRDVGASSTPFIINGVGQVGIGVTTMPSGYKLAVAGDIIAERVVVKLTGTWPDYVFKKKYDLRPLEQVEQFISQNSHLPEVPSAQEITDKGIDVGAMNAKLLQKVEELTLYLIEQNKENKMQNNEITILKQQLESIKIRNDKCPN